MKVAIDLDIRCIVDVLPDNATDENKFIVKNGYKVLELDNIYTDEGTFRELTDVDLSSLLLEKANEQFTLNMQQLKKSTPAEEILTWPEQKQEAVAWKKDNTVSTPMIDGILKTRDKYSKEELVEKILEKAFAYSSLSGEWMGNRQKQEDELGV